MCFASVRSQSRMLLLTLALSVSQPGSAEARELPQSLDSSSSQHEQQEETLQIMAVGHIMMGSDYPPQQPRLPPQDGATLFEETAALLQSADLTLGNLAAPLSDRGQSMKPVDNEHFFAFRSPSRYAQHLAKAGFDAVNVANNHIFDVGLLAYEDTLENLAAVGITPTGPAGSVHIQEIAGVSVALVSMTQPYVDFFESHHDVEAAAELIRELSRSHPIVVAAFHGGSEGESGVHTTRGPEYLGREYRGEPYRLAHALIDAGADLILGFGAHQPRAIEHYRGRLIAYSLGNFVTYGPFNLYGARGLSLILEVNLFPSGELASAYVHPLVLRPFGIPRLDPDGEVLEHLSWISEHDFPESSPQLEPDGALLIPEPPAP